MRCSPLAFELLNFSVGEFFRFEFAPSIEAAHVAEGEVTRLTDTALGALFRVGAGRNAKYSARRRTIRFIAGVAGSIETTVRVELPLLGGNPSQHPGFN